MSKNNNRNKLNLLHTQNNFTPKIFKFTESQCPKINAAPSVDCKILMSMSHVTSHLSEPDVQKSKAYVTGYTALTLAQPTSNRPNLTIQFNSF